MGDGEVRPAESWQGESCGATDNPVNRRAMLALLTLAVGCTRQNEEGETYLAALKTAIRESDRISVIEHSSWQDAPNLEKGQSPGPLVYRTVELNPQQRQAFLSSVERLDPKTQRAFAACIFEPHHTIRFQARDKIPSELQICFACNQVEWSETKAIPPQSIYDGLASALQEMGFEPKRDWQALAQARLKELANSPRADRSASAAR